MTLVAIYHIDDEDTPYRTKLPLPSDDFVTLSDFKAALNLPRNFKFFFASQDADYTLVKEEINDDLGRLPIYNGRIEAWLVTADGGSIHSDSSAKARKAALADTEDCGPSAADGRPAIGCGRPQSFHPQTYHRRPAAVAVNEESACTSETESTLSGLPKFPRHGSKLDRRSYRPQYYDKGRNFNRNWSTPLDGSSMMTSELDTTSFMESEDDRTSRFSTSTDITSVSRQHLKNKRKKRRFPRTVMSRASSVSSITESSMSINIITVMLNLDANICLGLKVVGRTDQLAGDRGIYINGIMKGSAAALDGRIEEGDMILQVNDISFENISNSDAVEIIRKITRKAGTVKLVVAKCFDPNPKCYFTMPCTAEPIRPIDPGAWVAHTNALRNGGGVDPHQQQPQQLHRRETALVSGPNGGVDFQRPSSVSTASNTSGSFAPTTVDAEKYFQDIKLDVNLHNMQTIARAMARPDSGLTVKDRCWLKINIPNAFLGSELVDWLHTHVHGFVDLKDARKFASRMLKEGFIRHTVNKITFAGQCYYVFGDLCGNFACMGLDEPREDSGGSSDHDTITPLLPLAPPLGWPVGAAPSLPSFPSLPFAGPTASMASGYAPMPSYRSSTTAPSSTAGPSVHAFGAAAAATTTHGFAAALGTAGIHHGFGPSMGPNCHQGFENLSGPSVHGFGPVSTQNVYGFGPATAEGHGFGSVAGPQVFSGALAVAGMSSGPPTTLRTELTSSSSGASADNGKKGAVGLRKAGVGPRTNGPSIDVESHARATLENCPLSPVVTPLSLPSSNPSVPDPRDAASSRQSFRIAMGNPCEFFVDAM